jgi:hypothetical protein
MEKEKPMTNKMTKTTEPPDTGVMLTQTSSHMRVNQAHQPKEGPPLVLVRADVLAPLLVYLRKFKTSIQSASPSGGPSRFQRPEDCELVIRTLGFTPEDFNGLTSLSNSMTHELEEHIDKLVTPQMARPEVAAATRFLRDLNEPSRSGGMAVIGEEEDDGE